MAKLLAGRRSGIVRMFPETDKSTMLPNTTPRVNRGRAEVGKKVNTMTERNKVASPTSNPGSDTSPRNKNPRWPAKRKFQQGGSLFAPSILPEKDPEFMFKDKYNTPLTPADKAKYDAWVKGESTKQGRDITMDQGAYDVQGFWKSGDYAKRDSDGHGTDTWKKPNHPTFSNESKYNGADGFHAGEWGKDGSYFPSRQTRDLYGPNYYSRLFGTEPNRPEHLNLSKSTNFFPSIFQQGGKLIPKNNFSVGDITKSSAYNSLPATIIKMVDPTGISSYGDVYNAWTDGKFDYQDVLEPIGALPIIGKLGKLGKYLGKGIQGLSELGDAKKIIKEGNKVVDMVGGTRLPLRGIKGAKPVYARQQYFNPLMRGEERVQALGKLHELDLARRTLRNNKVLNYSQYGVRAIGDVDDLLDVKSGVAATIPTK